MHWYHCGPDGDGRRSLFRYWLPSQAEYRRKDPLAFLHMPELFDPPAALVPPKHSKESRKGGRQEKTEWFFFLLSSLPAFLRVLDRFSWQFPGGGALP
jgi:hypothetical protein